MRFFTRIKPINIHIRSIDSKGHKLEIEIINQNVQIVVIFPLKVDMQAHAHTHILMFCQRGLKTSCTPVEHLIS